MFQGIVGDRKIWSRPENRRSATPEMDDFLLLGGVTTPKSLLFAGLRGASRAVHGENCQV